MITNREKRSEHPGWAVQYEDGSWLSYAHGFFRSADAFYGRLHDTKEEAEENAKEANEDWKDKLNYTIVPGWEPLCEHLRLQIDSLKEANILSPDNIFDIVIDLKYVIARLSPTWAEEDSSEEKKDK